MGAVALLNMIGVSTDGEPIPEPPATGQDVISAAEYISMDYNAQKQYWSSLTEEQQRRMHYKITTYLSNPINAMMYAQHVAGEAAEQALSGVNPLAWLNSMPKMIAGGFMLGNLGLLILHEMFQNRTPTEMVNDVLPG